MATEYKQLFLRVSPRAKELLDRFAKEDKRALSREFEVLVEQELARRSGIRPEGS
jgi:hypothetical protein